jgi:hypothetical protein
MVCIENGGRPNQPYASHEAALARAKSLAKQTHCRVFILAAIEVVTALVPESKVTFDIQEVL